MRLGNPAGKYHRYPDLGVRRFISQLTLPALSGRAGEGSRSLNNVSVSQLVARRNLAKHAQTLKRMAAPRNAPHQRGPASAAPRSRLISPPEWAGGAAQARLYDKLVNYNAGTAVCFCYVDTITGFKAPSCFPQAANRYDVLLSSSGSSCAEFPVVISTMGH